MSMNEQILSVEGINAEIIAEQARSLAAGRKRAIQAMDLVKAFEENCPISSEQAGYLADGIANNASIRSRLLDLLGATEQINQLKNDLDVARASTHVKMLEPLEFF